MQTSEQQSIKLGQDGCNCLTPKRGTEGAKLLKTDRVTDILEKLNRSPAGLKQESISSLYPLLLRELKALQHHLALFS